MKLITAYGPLILSPSTDESDDTAMVWPAVISVVPVTIIVFLDDIPDTTRSVLANAPDTTTFIAPFNGNGRELMFVCRVI